MLHGNEVLGMIVTHMKYAPLYSVVFWFIRSHHEFPSTFSCCPCFCFVFEIKNKMTASSFQPTSHGLVCYAFYYGFYFFNPCKVSL